MQSSSLCFILVECVVGACCSPHIALLSEALQENLSPCVLLQCVQFVEQYEPVVVQLLAEVMDPTFVCTVSIEFGFIWGRL